MKKTVITIAIVLLSINGFSQDSNDYLNLTRQAIKTEKEIAIKEIMQLSKSESEAFWKLYAEYQQATYLIQNKRIANIKDFANNYGNLTDEKADEIVTNGLDLRIKILKLKKTYYAKFKKIIPAGEAAKFFQAEDKIDTLINAELALEIPLIETK